MVHVILATANVDFSMQYGFWKSPIFCDKGEDFGIYEVDPLPKGFTLQQINAITVNVLQYVKGP